VAVIKLTQIIQRPVEGVFRTVIDVVNFPRWNPTTPREPEERFREGTYRSPARPGISYMLSPVQRLYGGPASKAVHFVNMPHYMFYAPNLTSKELGGGPVMGQYPYLISPGPHAYVILNVGQTEKAQINKEERGLLQDLCAYWSYFCMNESSANGPEH